MKSASLVVLPLLAIFAAIGTADLRAVELNIVALSGREGAHGPYDGPPGVFREFGTPAINNWEHVAYAASVEVFANQYQPARTENGIWFALGSTNREVVRSGVAEPGEAFEFRHFGQVNLSDANAVVFGATPDSHTYRNPGLWLYRPRGELTRLKTPTGRQSNPQPQGTLGEATWFAMNGHAHVAYPTTIAPTLEAAIVSTGATLLEPELGEAWFFDPNDEPFYPFSSVHSLRMNDSDNVAFGAQLQLADDLAVPALLKSYAGPYRVVARAASDGVEGPQLGERVVFTNSQFDATLNRQGDVAFAASVAGPGITSDNDAGIWRASGRERPELVVRAGDELPGVGPLHARFRDFSRPVINSSGTIAFYANAAPPGAPSATREGIWTYGDDGARVIAFNGTDGVYGPQMGPGVKFYAFDDPTINDAGVVAFKGYVRTLDNSTDLGSGIWAHDGRHLRAIVHTGQPLDLDPGVGTDLRTVEEVFLQSGVGSGEGLPRSLSDDGLLAFRLTFTDGSEGIFSARIGGVLVVPEPATVVLVVLGGMLLAGVRRRG